MGETEAAWRKQCALLPDRVDELPVVLAQGVKMARILDDDAQWRYHSQANRQLQLLTDKLVGARKTKSKGRNRLHVVRQMTASIRKANDG